MMRLILAAATLIALALPAYAQRLDTRVREVTRSPGEVACRLNANDGMKIETGVAKSLPMATLLQRPVETAPGIVPRLGFILEPGNGERFSIEIRFFAFTILDMRLSPAPPPAKVRVLIDGEDSGLALIVHADRRSPNDIFVEVPEAAQASAGERIVHARAIDVEVTNRDGTVTRYRFDGLRMAEAVEIVGLIRFSCEGDRAD
jgi:hypothetical protein